MNFPEVNISHPIWYLNNSIPNLTANLGCNYIRAIFWTTIPFIHAFNFLSSISLRKSVFTNFDNLSLTGFPNSFLEEDSWEIFLQQNLTTYIWINLITWTQFLNIFSQILLIRNDAFFLELLFTTYAIAPCVWRIFSKLFITYLVTQFLLLFWVLNRSYDLYLWALNQSSGPFVTGFFNNMFLFLILSLILSQIFQCLHHTVNLWSIVSERFSNLSFWCWFCRLRNSNLTLILLS